MGVSAYFCVFFQGLKPRLQWELRQEHLILDLDIGFAFLAFTIVSVFCRLYGINRDTEKWCKIS